MSPIQHLAVSPKLPTVLGDQLHLELPGYDIWFHYIRRAADLHYWSIVHIGFRFKEALSRALQIYPHAAGKFRHIDGHLVIELANTAIPLDIEYRLDSSSDSLLRGDWVVQDDLSPFVDAPKSDGTLSDNAPLFCVKLMFFRNETCIGFAWQHSLGEATTQLRFNHALSQFYQGLSMKFATPIFERPHFPIPSDLVVTKIWPHIPHLQKTCALTEVSMSLRPFEPVRWQIDSRDIEELHSALSKKRNDPSLSKQDCITAYFVAAMNYSRDNPVRAIRYMSNYRRVEAPFVAKDVAGNLLMDVIANVPSDIAGIATALRHAITESRDPDHIYHWLTLINSLKREACNAGKAFPYPADDNEILVNSLTTFDWWSAHFGFPVGTRYYMDRLRRNYAKVHRSNPVKGADGVWRARQFVDISVGVAPEVKPKLLETFARGVHYMLKDHSARL